MNSFEETNKTVTFVLIIDELKVKRKISKKFQKFPSNAVLMSKDFRMQSMNFSIKIFNPSRVYQFEIKRLPTQISYGNGKIEIHLKKAEKESWKPYADFDFETINLK
ncbi:hypothetical protein BpHYR1_013987 [Brachionus plicatilis]|uniref:Uncharacterized protein n=1 Tax=Brachionus plicatilis TaxID=10195 RepID=A0A3M7SSR7_BRAPC|nr:hypothetical protein BpHYR1_013987 [Brachionus plicatilis]